MGQTVKKQCCCARSHAETKSIDEVLPDIDNGVSSKMSQAIIGYVEHYPPNAVRDAKGIHGCFSTNLGVCGLSKAYNIYALIINTAHAAFLHTGARSGRPVPVADGLK